MLIEGRVGNDPDVRQIPSGKMVANFNLAVGKKDEETRWVRIALWEEKTEWADYIKKGDSVIVKGQGVKATERNGKTYYEMSAWEVYKSVGSIHPVQRATKPLPPQHQAFEQDFSFNNEDDIPF